MGKLILIQLRTRRRLLRIGKDNPPFLKKGNWFARWDQISEQKSQPHLICVRHSSSLWDVMKFAWINRNKPYGYEMRPLRKYFKRMGNMWYWQICYSDEINFGGTGPNLFSELWDYWRTCRAAKIEYEYKKRQGGR